MSYFRRQQAKITETQDAVTTANLAANLDDHYQKGNIYDSSNDPLMVVPHFDEYGHDVLIESNVNIHKQENSRDTEDIEKEAIMNKIDNPKEILSKVCDSVQINNDMLNNILEKSGYIKDEIKYKKMYLNSSLTNYRLEMIKSEEEEKLERLEKFEQKTPGGGWWPKSTKRPLLIGIVGNIGSGKTTITNMLTEKHFKELAFADSLKSIAENFGFHHDQLYGSQDEKNEINHDLGISARQFLQKFGTEVCRNALPEIIPEMNVGDSIWVKSLESKLRNLTCTCNMTQNFSELVDCECSSVNVVVSDCRFLNEAALIRKYGGYIIKLERDSAQIAQWREQFKQQDQHSSEVELNGIRPDYGILNNGTIEQLEFSLQSVLNDISQHHRFHEGYDYIDEKKVLNEHLEKTYNTFTKIDKFLLIAILLFNAGIAMIALNDYDIKSWFLSFNLFALFSVYSTDYIVKLIKKIRTVIFDYNELDDLFKDIEFELDDDDETDKTPNRDNTKDESVKNKNETAINETEAVSNETTTKDENEQTLNRDKAINGVIFTNNVFISLYAVFTIYFLYSYKGKVHNIENYLLLNFIIMLVFYVFTQTRLTSYTNTQPTQSTQRIQPTQTKQTEYPSYYYITGLNVSITLTSCWIYYLLIIR